MRRDALGQLDDGRLGAAGLDQTLQEAFEMQAVDQHHVGLGHGGRVGRARLVDMGVAVRPDDRRDRDAVAADILGEVADDREAGDDVEPIGLRGGEADRA